MRILTIGVGGAGSRIVDQLYYQDQRSSISCISAVVVDTDGNFLSQLKYLPDESKIFFPAIDPDVHFDVQSTVDLNEVMTKVKRMDNIDIDAIMIFTGLGGNLSDIIPELTKEIRKSYFEPVFAVCTLPYLREGKKLAAKAAEDLEKIEEFVDGIILFDNETWYRKIKASFEVRIDEEGNPVNIPSPFGKVFPDNPRDIYRMLNDKMSRQIGLLLRAGEFNEEGIDSAEVVLDAGEVLNTLKGNGITAVGYAIETLPSNWTDIFDKWLPEKQQTNFSELSQKRATRIVALAKKAVYEDISVPCDLTSAEKALILIAGPSRELSMKGFQTVRKWIDSSIAGLEMRSGDYPVSNTRYVGIIIMLSGLHNIPRLEEIKRLRADYLLELEERKAIEEDQALLEEEMLLLSGMNSEHSVPGFFPADIAAVDNQRVYDYMEEISSSGSDQAQSYDHYTSGDDILEEEAMGFIGGYSSRPPKEEIKSNSNVPPIIEAGDEFFMDSEFRDDSKGSLDLKDFLEEESEEPRGQELAQDPRFIEYKKQYSFSELLEDETEPDSFRDNEEKEWINKAPEPVRAVEPEDEIPLTSKEYVIGQEYREYSTEKAVRKPEGFSVKDDQISILGKKEKGKDDNGIVLPGRSERNVADMTRMTSVNMGNAPKDSIFGIKGVKGPLMPKEKSDVAMVGEKLSLGKTGFSASDKTFSAGNFSAGSKARPSDNAFGGGSITPGKKILPNDSTFSGGRVSMSKNITANDSTFSGGRVSVRPNIRPRDDTVSGGISSPGKVKKPKELLSDNVRVKSVSSKPRDDIFVKSEAKKVNLNRPKDKGRSDSSQFKKTDFSAGKQSSKKKESDDEDLFWV